MALGGKLVRFCVFLACLLCVALWSPPLFAGDSSPEDTSQDIGIDQKLGEFIPLDLEFLDADSHVVVLGDLVDRPTIVTLVYYHCPTICKPLLGGVQEVVEKTDLEPGVDYNILTISFDDRDTPASARVIRENFTNPLEKRIQGNGWKFLTADSTTIAALADAVGFRFKRREKDFAHGTSLIVISPEGEIIRYLYGLRFMPFDLRMAVSEANRGQVAPSIPRVLRYCFSYDPEGRRYVFNVNRIAGAGIILLTVGWVVYVNTTKTRRGKVKQPS